LKIFKIIKKRRWDSQNYHCSQNFFNWPTIFIYETNKSCKRLCWWCSIQSGGSGLGLQKHSELYYYKPVCIEQSKNINFLTKKWIVVIRSFDVLATQFLYILAYSIMYRFDINLLKSISYFYFRRDVMLFEFIECHSNFIRYPFFLVKHC
jgi:hypothetical protein